MRIININLASEESRENWFFYALKRLAFFAGLLAFMIVTLFSLGLYLCNNQLEGSLKSIKSKSENFNSQGAEQEKNLKDQVVQLNSKIHFFSESLKGCKEISGIISDISNNIPESVKLSALDFSSKESGFYLSIKGTSRNRAGFLAVKKYLEGSKKFSDLQSPLSNITKKENLEFLLNVKVNNSAFNNLFDKNE